MTNPGCAEFVDRLEELALGEVDEPERARLLTHASSCPTCSARLGSMVELTDKLLLLAPPRDPATGFESRVLARMNANWTTPRRSGRLWGAAALVAAAAVIALVSFVFVRTSNDSTPDAATIVRDDGSRAGEVYFVHGDHPYIVVIVDQPRPGNGEVYCELVLADGRSERVGSWDYDDVRQHVWAVGIEPQWLDAVQMNVVLEDGTVVGTAQLT